jgi:hypothetical protein
MKKIVISFCVIFASFSLALSQSTCTYCSDPPSGGYATNIGYGSAASGSHSVSIGANSQAAGLGSISIGSFAKTLIASDNGIAIGTRVEAANGLSMVIGTGPESGALTNSFQRTLMIGFDAIYPTLFVEGAENQNYNGTKTGRIGIGNVTEPEAKLHLQADAGETAAIFIEPNNWMAGESANLVLGTLSLGISSDYNKGFVFKSAKNYLFKDGKMGIGSFNANEPEAKLHIKSNMFEEASVFIEPYRDDIESGWYANLYLGTKTNIISGNSSLGLAYSTSKYHIFQGGNVGIGTTEPLELLHVQDARGAALFSEGRLAVVGQGPDPVISLIRHNERTWNMFNGVMETLFFSYNSTEWEDATVGLTENLGLFIKDGITVSDMQSFGAPKADIYVVQEGTDVEIAAEYTTKQGGRLFFVPRLGGYNFCPSSQEGDAGIFWSDTDNQNASGGLVIGPHDTDDHVYGMRIDSEGNVGIGLAEPDAKLDVKGKLQVNGSDHPDGPSFVVNNHEQYPTFLIFPTGQTFISNKLWAQEIEVLANVDWPDFVFSDSYRLKPLDEVEDFISKNNHLPDMPSQEDVTENGINLGEMDALLLQKIEELTLYIIEQDKKIEELKSETKDLREKLENTNQQNNSN